MSTLLPPRLKLRVSWMGSFSLILQIYHLSSSIVYFSMLSKLPTSCSFPPKTKICFWKGTQLDPFLLKVIGAIYLQKFSATLYFSHDERSLSPLLPPKTYTEESWMQKVDGKNALLFIIGAKSWNTWYLLRNVLRLLKLSSTSEPPSINIPSLLGRWQQLLKYMNFYCGRISGISVHFFLKKSN